MKAITLWQPWASLIAAGVKHHETRSWAPPVSLIGQRIAIHAAKREVDFISMDRTLFRKLRELEDCGEIETPYPLGAVVCTAVLAGAFQCGRPVPGDMVYVEKSIGISDSPLLIDTDPFGDFSPGRWAWLLDDVDRLDRPIRVQGHQGLWNWQQTQSSSFPAPFARAQSAPGIFPATAQE